MSINIKKKALNVKNGDTYDNFDMFFLGDVEEAVDDWFEEHPDGAVPDGSLTEAKLSESLTLKTVKDYVTPEMFGAVGNGTTDDTVAVRSALSYANTNKVPMKLLSQYLISEGLTVNSDVAIIGERRGVGFKVNNDIVALTLPQNSTGQRLENIAFTMQNRVGVAIKINYVRWATISDIYVISAENAIIIDGAYYCNIERCDFHYCNKAAIVKNCGGITFNEMHINESSLENIYIKATSSVQICNSTLENPLSVAQIVCDSGYLSVTESYLGDSNYPAIVVNDGHVKVANMTQSFLRTVVNGGHLYLDNVDWGGATANHRIVHNDGFIYLGNHRAVSYLDIETEKYGLITAPVKKTFSPDGLFVDTSNVVLGNEYTSIHEYGENYHGGSRIKVYSTASDAALSPRIKIPFSIPAGLVDKPLILKIVIDNKDRIDNPDYRPTGGGGNDTILLTDESDLYYAGWTDFEGGQPLINNLYNYSSSWKRAFFTNDTYNEYNIYIPVKARSQTGYIEFFGVVTTEYEKIFGFEYMALLRATDAYMFAKYI